MLTAQIFMIGQTIEERLSCKTRSAAMALSPQTKVFFGFVLLAICWLSGASLHAADGPAKRDASKVLGPVVLDLQFAMYHHRLPAGQVDLTKELGTGLPIQLPQENLLQALLCAGKAAFVVILLIWLVGLTCEMFPSPGSERSRGDVEDLELGAAFPTLRDGLPTDSDASVNPAESIEAFNEPAPTPPPGRGGKDHSKGRGSYSHGGGDWN